MRVTSLFKIKKIVARQEPFCNKQFNNTSDSEHSCALITIVIDSNNI